MSNQAPQVVMRTTDSTLRHPRAALAVVLAGTVMIVLDFFIVNVMLPAIQADLHAGQGAVEWILAGYGLPLAVLLITAGRLGDRFGHRRVFMVGIALFTLSSIACGISPSPGTLVGARVMQGASAALISPTVLSLIGLMFPGPERMKALRSYGLSMGIAAVGGQIVGGVLVHADILGLGWRACFLINVPVGIAALALAPSVIPDLGGRRRVSLDPLGTTLVSGALVALVLPLVEGRQHGWPEWTWLSLAAAPALFAAFAAQQRRLSSRGGAPLVEPRLLREPLLRAGLITQLVFWCGQASVFLVLALYLQDGRGMSALDAGLVFTFLALPYLAASMRVPQLMGRLGRRVIALGGLAVAAGDLALIAGVEHVGVGGSVVFLIPGLMLNGFGQGLAIMPMVQTVMAGLDPRQAGAASGLLSTMQQVGNAIGVAITGVIFFGAADHGFARAFQDSLIELAGLGVAVAILASVLPLRARRPRRPVGAPAAASVATEPSGAAR